MCSAGCLPGLPPSGMLSTHLAGQFLDTPTQQRHAWHVNRQRHLLQRAWGQKHSRQIHTSRGDLRLRCRRHAHSFLPSQPCPSCFRALCAAASVLGPCVPQRLLWGALARVSKPRGAPSSMCQMGPHPAWPYTPVCDEERTQLEMHTTAQNCSLASKGGQAPGHSSFAPGLKVPDGFLHVCSWLEGA